MTIEELLPQEILSRVRVYRNQHFTNKCENQVCECYTEIYEFLDRAALENPVIMKKGATLLTFGLTVAHHGHLFSQVR